MEEKCEEGNNEQDGREREKKCVEEKCEEGNNEQDERKKYKKRIKEEFYIPFNVDED